MVKQAVRTVRIPVRRRARRAVGSSFDLRAGRATIPDGSPPAAACRPSAPAVSVSRASLRIMLSGRISAVRQRGRGRSAVFLRTRPASQRLTARNRQVIRRIYLSGLAVPVAALAIGVADVAPAWGANVVNATFHVPASVQTSPCSPGDVVNLSGDIHVVITATADGSGGYQTNTSLNSHLSGTSVTTGTRYVNSETQEEDWYAGAPFPTVHTSVHDFDLISQSGTPDYVLYMQMHETVTALGVPAAAVDNFWMDCRG